MKKDKRLGITLAWCIGYMCLVAFFVRSVTTFATYSFIYWVVYCFVILGSERDESVDDERRAKFIPSSTEELSEDTIDILLSLSQYYDDGELAAWCVRAWKWPREHAEKIIKDLKNYDK